MINVEILKKSKGATIKYANFPNVDSSYVKSFRKKYDLTQKRLAILLNVTKKTIEKWEQGTNKVSGAAAILFYLYDENPKLMKKIIDVTNIEEIKNYNSEIVVEENQSINYSTNRKKLLNNC